MAFLTSITEFLLLLRRVLHWLLPASWAMTMLLSHSLSSWTYNGRPAKARKCLRDPKIDTQSNKLAKAQQQIAAQIAVLLLLRMPASLHKNKKLSQGGTLTSKQNWGREMLSVCEARTFCYFTRITLNQIISHTSFGTILGSSSINQPSHYFRPALSCRKRKGNHVTMWSFNN